MTTKKAKPPAKKAQTSTKKTTSKKSTTKRTTSKKTVKKAKAKTTAKKTYSPVKAGTKAGKQVNPTHTKKPILSMPMAGDNVGVMLRSKGTGNFVKKNGGSNANDFISGHSQKHMYNPNTVSTPKKTQYGKDINVSELRRDTMLNPDSVDYDDIRNTIAYKKNYDFNISTPDTPTGQHRIFINLNNPSRHSQFPYFRKK
ncbi:hypothetical protein D5F11_025590 [Siminovitchia terrae]|uniref:Uncharacterized protein n=1 Tax=Siminovitchia terrae TaxID=1914933 RepID=A0A429X1A7_SIMTE|nr:hypothetical protein [Siminovitchia terrae]RST56910.1 hypothetical protein D5F11_025590 [Siminovitchia terrae]